MRVRASQVGAIVALVAATNSARAEDRQHVSLALHAGFGANIADVDQHWGQTGYTVGGRLGYELDVLRHLSVGASLVYVYNPDAKAAHALSARLRLRPHLALSDAVDLGLLLEGGGLLVLATSVPDERPEETHDRLFRGWILGAGPEFRIRIAPHASVDLCGEVYLGLAEDPGSPGWYWEKHGGTVGFGLWAGISQSF